MTKVRDRWLCEMKTQKIQKSRCPPISRGIIGMNNWETAFELAFSLYLDMINLLLEILEAMGNS